MKKLEELTKQEVQKEIGSMETMGFQYLQQWQMEFGTPDRFKLPSGFILDETELTTFFQKTKPQIGNKKHLEIINALRYYELITSEQYTKQRFGYPSFIDKKDEEKCRKKYNP